ncbi:conserved protein of unknown function [Methylocella tundrae]|uniref:Uncharacterized protein n=1 Tax=Methylocella tundrae TaxID=227605 RepID=A0A4U8Z443_METTU|nr:conserved protein of unknown function [Methylocella tundrae]
MMAPPRGGHPVALLSEVPSLQNAPGVGVNTSFDVTNKLAVKSSAVLFDNIGHGVQFKVNKSADTDTASLLYQTGYSGRAEMGLCGDDNFHLKTSADGSTWIDGIVQRTLSIQNSGDVNDSSSGAGLDHDYSLAFSIPPNFLRAGRAIRVSAHYRVTVGSAPPLLTHKIKLGSVIVGQTGGYTPNPGETNVQAAVSWLIQAIADPSGASGIECALSSIPSGVGSATNTSVTPMPVLVPTNGVLALEVSTLWASAGTGVNQIKLSQLIIEALN